MDPLEPVYDAIPLLSAMGASALIAATRELIVERLRIQPHFFPVLLVVAGTLVAVGARLVGVDIGDLNPETADLTMWQTALTGALTGAATVGLHQAQKQLRKPPD